MKVSITEKQLKTILSKEIGEQSEPVGSSTSSGDGSPKSGVSSKQGGGEGYPEVGKWPTSGQQPERGSANPIGNDKWGEKNQQPKRGPGNQLKEQVNIPDFKPKIPQNNVGSTYVKKPDVLQPGTHISQAAWYNKLDTHDYLNILEMATAFVPIVSLGIGLVNAYAYYREGDTKMAGLMGLFSILPMIGTIPGVKKLGQVGMEVLASKLTKQGSKAILTDTEKEVMYGIKTNQQNIENKLKTIANNAISNNPNLNIKTTSKLKKIGKFGLKAGGQLTGYATVAKTYDVAYDKLNNNDTNIYSRLINKNQPIVNYKSSDLELVDGIWIPKKNN